MKKGFLIGLAVWMLVAVLYTHAVHKMSGAVKKQ